MAGDQFEQLAPGLDAPSGEFEAITPSDTTDLTMPTRAVYVGTAGNITAVDLTGTAVVFSSVPAGAILPIRASRINATGTSASNLVSLR